MNSDGGAKTAKLTCPQEENAISTETLLEEFTGPQVDPCSWIIVHANWGGIVAGEDYNGGVLRDNVALRNGLLVLSARGNHYSGSLRGINSDNSPRKDGRRTGAAIKTRQRYLGGRFEARVKIIDQLGVVSAMWTFFHEQTPDGLVRNHEIDIEFPGQAHAHAAPSFDHVTFTTWTGLKAGESTPAFRPLASMADGQFHVLRFDWLPPTPDVPGSVEFYIDGQLQHVARTNVPSEPANLWLGAWFPPAWAGEPEFSEREMLVDWIRINP